MLELSLRKSVKKEINVGTNSLGEVKFTIEYPTLSQHEELETLLFSMINADGKQDLSLMPKYMRAYIARTVKAWTNLPEPCKLVDNKICDEQLLQLTADINQLTELYNLIKEELDFTDTDKKKL